MWKTVILLGCFVGASISSPIGAKNMPITNEKLAKDKNDMAMSTLNLPSNATSIRADITDGFTCDGKTYGYYADIENDCQIFHVCLPVVYPDGRENTFRWSFICPEETLFSQESFTCVRSLDMSFDCADSARFYELNRNFGIGPDSSLEMHNMDSDMSDTFRKSPTDDILKKTPIVTKPTVPSTTAATPTPYTRRRFGDSNLRRKPTKAAEIQHSSVETKPTEANILKKIVPSDIKPLVNRQQFINKSTNKVRTSVARPVLAVESIKPVYEDTETAPKTHFSPVIHEEVKKVVVPVESVVHQQASPPAFEPVFQTTNKDELPKTITPTVNKDEDGKETLTNVKYLEIPQVYEDIKPIVEASQEGEEMIKKTALQPLEVSLHEPHVHQQDESMGELPLVKPQQTSVPSETELLKTSASSAPIPTEEKHSEEMATLPKESLPVKSSNSELEEPAQHSVEKPLDVIKDYNAEPAVVQEMKPESAEMKPEMEALEQQTMKVNDMIAEPMKHEEMMVEPMKHDEPEAVKEEIMPPMSADPIVMNVLMTETKLKNDELKTDEHIDIPVLNEKTAEVPKIESEIVAIDSTKLPEYEMSEMNTEDQKTEIIKAISNLVTQANLEADSIMPELSTLKSEGLIAPTSEIIKEENHEEQKPEKIEGAMLSTAGSMEHQITPAYIPVQVIMMDEGMTEDLPKPENEIDSQFKHHSEEHKEPTEHGSSLNDLKVDTKLTSSEAIVVESLPAEEMIVKSSESLPDKDAAQIVLETDPVAMTENQQSSQLSALKAEILPMSAEEVKIVEEHPHVEIASVPIETVQTELPKSENPSTQPDHIQQPILSETTQVAPAQSENVDLPKPQSTFEQIYEIASNLVKTATMSATVEDTPIIRDLNDEAKKDTTFSKSTPSDDNIASTEIHNDELNDDLSQTPAPLSKDTASNQLRAEKIGELVERTDLDESTANRIDSSRSLHNIDPRKRRFLFRSDSR